MAYVDAELRGITKLEIRDSKAWFNLKISTTCYKEVLTFRVYQAKTELLFEVSDCEIISKPNCKYGTIKETKLEVCNQGNEW